MVQNDENENWWKWKVWSIENFLDFNPLNVKIVEIFPKIFSTQKSLFRSKNHFWAREWKFQKIENFLDFSSLKVIVSKSVSKKYFSVSEVKNRENFQILIFLHKSDFLRK